MKKILILISSLVMSIFLVACDDTSDISAETQTNDEAKQEESQEITITEEQEKRIQEILTEMTEGTATEGATYKISTEKVLASQNLRIDVIKPITDVMTSYGTFSSDDTVEAFRKSLVFETVNDIIKEELDLQADGMQVYLFDSEEHQKENEWYTLKTIN